MFKIIALLHDTRKKDATPDNCSACTHKLCCVIFDILAESQQGRNPELVKPLGKKCEHLGINGECCIYNNRHNLHGYDSNCEGYSCHNLGPLIDNWIIERSVDVEKHSKELALIMRGSILFVTTGNRYDERYLFLKEVFFIKFSSPNELYKGIENISYMNKEFDDWIISLPENKRLLEKLNSLCL